MIKTIVSICLCLPGIIFANKLTNYKELKSAIMEGDSITLTFDESKVKGLEKDKQDIDFLPNTFNRADIKKNGNIIYTSYHILPSSLNLIPIIHSVNYVFKSNGDVIIIGSNSYAMIAGSNSNAITNDHITTYKERTKIGTGVTLQSKKS